MALGFSSNPFSLLRIRMPTAVVNAMPSTLQASIPFLSSMPTIWAFSSSPSAMASASPLRSEEHTSELQSPYDLVCRLLLEKKKKKKQTHRYNPTDHIG